MKHSGTGGKSPPGPSPRVQVYGCNHIQVVDLHNESLVWLLPYGEVQKAEITFG